MMEVEEETWGAKQNSCLQYFACYGLGPFNLQETRTMFVTKLNDKK